MKVTVYQWRKLTTVAPRQAESTLWSYASIGAHGYPNSYIPEYAKPAQGSADWNLDPSCVQLRARFGNGDQSDQGAVGNVVLSGDGVQLYSGSFGLTQSDYASFDIKGVFRLAYSWTIDAAGQHGAAGRRPACLRRPRAPLRLLTGWRSRPVEVATPGPAT